MRTENYIFEETFANQFDGDSSLPSKPEAGKVYYCKEHSISVHLCPCGCGDKIFITFNEGIKQPNNWLFDGKNSFSPSINAIYHNCKSHYWITNGKVVW